MTKLCPDISYMFHNLFFTVFIIGSCFLWINRPNFAEACFVDIELPF